MDLNAIQKKSSKQSLCKVSSEAAVHRCSSKMSHRCFPMNMAKYLKTAFLQKTFGCCFYQLDKVTVQYWTSPSHLNQKHNV